jgi:hypothetical protein
MKLRLLTVIAALAAFGFLARPAEAMTLFPPSFDFTVNPGDTIKDVLRVFNEDPFPITLQPQPYNFTFVAGDETEGTPDFYPAGEVRDGHELAPWIEIEDVGPMVIAPNERVNIPFTIQVPKDAVPGGHFGAVHMATVATDQPVDRPQVGIKAATAVLIFVRVNGERLDALSVEQFSGEKTRYDRLPVDFTVRVSNTGSTHLRPTGNVFITDMLGRQVASIQVNPAFRSVLPGSARRFVETWQKRRLPDDTSEFVKQWRNFAFGKYKATLILNYGPDNNLLSAEYTFWVVPWMALLAYAGGIVLILLVVGYGFRGYNRLVIRRYEAMKRRQQNT